MNGREAFGLLGPINVLGHKYPCRGRGSLFLIRLPVFQDAPFIALVNISRQKIGREITRQHYILVLIALLACQVNSSILERYAPDNCGRQMDGWTKRSICLVIGRLFFEQQFC